MQYALQRDQHGRALFRGQHLSALPAQRGFGRVQQLKVSGGLVGNGDWHLGKSLTANKNLTTPAEVIAFPINYFVNKNLINLITGGSKFIWTEVAP